jgi:DNA-binding transcriptional ArsR family regulator
MPTPDSDAIFSALADPTRRAILSLIGEHEELPAGEIAAHFDSLGRTAISSHLRILRLAGLIAERRDGRFRHYSVTPSPADAVVAFLTSVYQNSLDHLASAVQDASGGAPSQAEERSA